MINHDIFTEFTIIYILLCRPLSFRLFHHITSHHHNARIIHVYGVRTRTQLTLLIERSKWNNNNNKTKKAKKNTHKRNQTNTNKFLCAQTNGNSHIWQERKSDKCLIVGVGNFCFVVYLLCVDLRGGIRLRSVWGSTCTIHKVRLSSNETTTREKKFMWNNQFWTRTNSV